MFYPSIKDSGEEYEINLDNSKTEINQGFLESSNVDALEEQKKLDIVIEKNKSLMLISKKIKNP